MPMIHSITDYYDAQWHRFCHGAVIIDRMFSKNSPLHHCRPRARALTQWNANVINPISPRLEKGLSNEASQLPEIRTKFGSEKMTAADLRVAHFMCVIQFILHILYLSVFLF
jgi:hypothetical protein